MSSSDSSDDSKGSSQSANSVRSHKGISLVDTTTQTVDDSSSRKGVKPKAVRLHKAEKMPVNRTSPADESRNKLSKSSMDAENIARSHKGRRPVDPTSQKPSSRHWDDFMPGSKLTLFRE